MDIESIVEKMKAGKGLIDILNLLNEIERALSAPYIYEEQMRALINKINKMHDENMDVYKMTHGGIRPVWNGRGVSVNVAQPHQLRQDLEWKHFYLRAKFIGKTIEEIIKEWKKMIN